MRLGMQITMPTVTALLIVLGGGISAGDDYGLDRYTIDGGGAMFSTGGDFELSGTVGQPDAGTMSGGAFTLTGGFWFEQLPCDCDYDGGVNLFDYDGFQGCSGGPGSAAPGCVCFDLDNDNDVDLADFARLQQLFAGG